MCKLCDRFWERLWAHSEAWERAHSNDNDLWSKESDQTRKLIKQASAITDSDDEAAFRLYVEAAEAGSVMSMARVGWHHWTGTGTPPDPGKAQEYYRRAIRGGSWTATIHYARLLAELGHHQTSDEVLEDGVAVGFVPSYFWLAWLRYKRSGTRQTCGQVRPLLEFAAKKGHPRARRILAQMMLLGKLGSRQIRPGLLLHLRSGTELAREMPNDAPEAAR